MKNLRSRSKITSFIRPPFSQPLHLPITLCFTAIYGKEPKQAYHRRIDAASTLRQKRRVDFLHERNQRLCCTLEQYDQRLPVKFISLDGMHITAVRNEAARNVRLFDYFKDVNIPQTIYAPGFDKEKLLETIILRNRRLIQSFSPFDHLIMIAQQRWLALFGHPSRKIVVMPSGFPRAVGENSTYAERRKYREEKKAYRKKHAFSYGTFDQIIKQVERSLKMDRFFQRKFNTTWCLATIVKAKTAVKKDERYQQWQQLLNAM
jgi:hypothetical protein